MAELASETAQRRGKRPIHFSLKPISRLLARWLLAWIFIRAGLPKIADPLSFASSIEAIRIVSGTLVLWVALLLPWLELVIGLGIMIPWLKRASALIMTALLSLFIVLHASAWFRGLDLNCGCFGLSEDSPNYAWLILRNLGLFGLSLFIFLTWSDPSDRERKL